MWPICDRELGDVGLTKAVVRGSASYDPRATIMRIRAGAFTRRRSSSGAGRSERLGRAPIASSEPDPAPASPCRSRRNLGGARALVGRYTLVPTDGPHARPIAWIRERRCTRSSCNATAWTGFNESRVRGLYRSKSRAATAAHSSETALIHVEGFRAAPAPGVTVVDLATGIGKLGAPQAPGPVHFLSDSLPVAWPVFETLSSTLKEHLAVFPEPVTAASKFAL